MISSALIIVLSPLNIKLVIRYQLSGQNSSVKSLLQQVLPPSTRFWIKEFWILDFPLLERRGKRF
jgi:hypothetical protein